MEVHLSRKLARADDARFPGLEKERENKIKIFLDFDKKGGGAPAAGWEVVGVGGNQGLTLRTTRKNVIQTFRGILAFE